jgi:hypothetical protein
VNRLQVEFGKFRKQVKKELLKRYPQFKGELVTVAVETNVRGELCTRLYVQKQDTFEVLAATYQYEYQTPKQFIQNLIVY